MEERKFAIISDDDGVIKAQELIDFEVVRSDVLAARNLLESKRAEIEKLCIEVKEIENHLAVHEYILGLADKIALEKAEEESEEIYEEDTEVKEEEIVG